jgi:hypothetical protein
MTPRQDKPAEMHAISLEAEQNKFAQDFLNENAAN